MAAKKTTPKNGLRITTKREGWRRAERVWTGTTEVLAKEFTKVQLFQLADDPMLVVEQIEIATE